MNTPSALDALLKSAYRSALHHAFPSRPTPWYRRIWRLLKGEAWRDTAREYLSLRSAMAAGEWGGNGTYFDVITREPQ